MQKVPAYQIKDLKAAPAGLNRRPSINSAASSELLAQFTWLKTIARASADKKELIKSYT